MTMNKFLYCLLACFFTIGKMSIVLAEGEAVQKPFSNTYESIKVIHNPCQSQLQELDVSNWPTWRKEVSEFTWYFSADETAYILEGEVIVMPEGVPESEGVLLKKGDLVTFSAGLISRWVIKKEIYKHYSLKGTFFGSQYYWRAVFKLKAAKKYLDQFF